MQLRPCRGAAPALTRPRAPNVPALQHAMRSFHISAPANDESSGRPAAPGNSLRARSQAAGARIQNLPRAAPPSGGNRVISPVARRIDYSGPRELTPRTPRVLTRVPDGPRTIRPNLSARGGSLGGGARRPGGFRDRRPGGAAKPPRKARRKRGGEGGQKDDGTPDPDAFLSPTMLEYMLELKAKRRALRPYTPHDPTKEELRQQSTLSATLAQPGGAVALLDARLRRLADRSDLSSPAFSLAQARRLAHGKFVKFTSDEEREAVLAFAQKEQARVARKLSAQKGQEIAPKPLEFAELDPAVRNATTAALVSGVYKVHARGILAGPDTSKDVAARTLDLNPSYVGKDAGRFLSKLDLMIGA